MFVKFTPSAPSGEGPTSSKGLCIFPSLIGSLSKNPADTFKVGDKVSAQIISLDSDKISLSIKALKADPWKDAEEKFKKGTQYKGTVVKVNPFGAFVRVDGDIQGLCHISEFGTDEQMKKTIAVGETYDFYVQSVSGKEHRMGLGFGKPKSKGTGSGHRAGSDRRKSAEEKV